MASLRYKQWPKHMLNVNQAVSPKHSGNVSKDVKSSVHTQGIYPYYSGDKGSDSACGDNRDDKMTV